MAFTSKDVMELRQRTGVGMMDCKKALVATDGDMEAAIDFLREKGMATAAKKEARIAAEGIVYAASKTANPFFWKSTANPTSSQAAPCSKSTSAKLRNISSTMLPHPLKTSLRLCNPSPTSTL